MEAKEFTLQPILEGEKQYVIPLFQRGYSWKKNRWQTLWNDLLDIYEANDKREHFMGAVVSMPIEFKPAGVNKLLLIDGQQRLTTFFLILTAMRDLAQKENQLLATQIEELYLINKFGSDSNKMKLLPSQSNKDTFQELIFGKVPSDNQNSIYMAYAYFRKKLLGSDNQGNSIDLSRFLSILKQQIIVVSIVLNNDENPYLIFESLNAKGEPLTQADLVRNYILMRINDSGEQEIAYKDFWVPMQNKLGDELSNFLWRFLNKDGAFVRLNSIYDALKRKLANKDSYEVIDFLMELDTYSKFYLRLIDPSNESESEISSRLKRLNTWEIKTAYPFLLNIYHDFDEKHLNKDEFCKILDMIESFVIRRFFCRIPTNILNKLFISLYNSLNKKDIVSSIETELIIQNWPNDSTFLSGLERFPIYLSGTKKCRLILDSLENALTNNKEPVDLKFPSISIEHIMPQKLNESWENTLGSEARNTHSIYLHTLGNLTLTGLNEPMGNSPFSKKRKTFENSNFFLNRSLSTQSNWNSDQIITRAKELGETAIEIWKHPGGNEIVNSGSFISSTDPTGFKPNTFQLFGNSYFVETWREMLLLVLKILAKDHEEDIISKIVLVKTNHRPILSLSPDGMNTPIQIEESQLWVEANQSSKSILKIIRQVMEILGYREEDFSAEWN